MTRQRQVTSNDGSFQPGTLWKRLRATSAKALKQGALKPINTQATYCEDKGVWFLVRVVSGLISKPPHRDDFNPFLPYDESLFVANASPSHVCVLNKFNVVDSHLLVVTREFEHQETQLSGCDFLALWKCMREFEALGFYNSGIDAGASQRHKHLQLVPLPLVERAAGRSATLSSRLDELRYREGEVVHCDLLPGRNAFVRLNVQENDDPGSLAIRTLALYRKMMQRVGIQLPADQTEQISAPYNLLACRRWMLVVPRACESFCEVSLNSLAFAGALLVHNAQQREQLCNAGLFAALQSVAVQER